MNAAGQEDKIMGETRYIAAGRFIDGSGADVRRNVVLTVQDSRITAIASAADTARVQGVTVDDFSHCTIVPALIDCSVSLSRSSSIVRNTSLSTVDDPGEQAAMRKRHISYCYGHGVLGAADSGGCSGPAGRTREASTEAGLIEIRTAAPLCRNTQDCRVDTPGSGDFIRINYTANIEDEEVSQPRFSPQDLSRILGRKGAKKAVVVANGPQQVREALEAGCDAVEQGYGMGEDNLRTMVKNNILWIPSVVRAKNGLDGSGSGGSVCCRFSLRYVAPGKAAPGDEALWKKVLAGQLAQLRSARSLGVPAAVGTGAGSTGILHGESAAEEIKLFLKAGYTLEETIQCASENGARFFNIDRLGRLDVGQRATFLIVRGTIKQLPRKLSYLEGIYVDGRPSSSYRKM